MVEYSRLVEYNHRCPMSNCPLAFNHDNQWDPSATSVLSFIDYDHKKKGANFVKTNAS